MKCVYRCVLYSPELSLVHRVPAAYSDRVMYVEEDGVKNVPKAGSTSMALLASFNASGKANSFVNAAARFVYPLASAGLRLMDSA